MKQPRLSLPKGASRGSERSMSQPRRAERTVMTQTPEGRLNSQ
jgi:hypothetical protein